MQSSDLFARLLALFKQGSGAIDEVLTSIEVGVRNELASRGASPAVQTVILLGAVLFIAVLLARLARGVVRFALLLVMAAVAVQIVSGSG